MAFIVAVNTVHINILEVCIPLFRKCICDHELKYSVANPLSSYYFRLVVCVNHKQLLSLLQTTFDDSV